MGSGVRAAAYVSDFHGGGLPLTAPKGWVWGGCASVHVGVCTGVCVCELGRGAVPDPATYRCPFGAQTAVGPVRSFVLSGVGSSTARERWWWRSVLMAVLRGEVLF